ncbi:MAG TPA: TIM barrel protein, partial [Chitinophagaceae bacterium]|nr:TIM barrel protein [Chitinophagaceae bacterium]
MLPHRRTFIKQTASAATALLLSALDRWAVAEPFVMNQPSSFSLKVLATNWGYAGSLDAYCAQVRKEGYDGIEIWWPMEKKDQDELFSLLKKYNLEVGFLCGGYQSVFREHLDHFRRMTEAAAGNTVQKPLYLNCHSGKDYFSFEENEAFIDHTTELARRTGIPVCHETHRSRLLYSAPAGRRYLEQKPDLRLTLDASHWCNVSESLLQDQPS